MREAMTEADIEIILQRGLEKYPHAKPRIISDNGPQFIARDFKEFIRIAGLSHMRTSPYYPQSNGKIERWHKSLKADCIRPGVPLNLQDARRLVTRFVEHYNTVRLHSAIRFSDFQVHPVRLIGSRANSFHTEGAPLRLRTRSTAAYRLHHPS